MSTLKCNLANIFQNVHLQIMLMLLYVSEILRLNRVTTVEKVPCLARKQSIGVSVKSSNRLTCVDNVAGRFSLYIVSATKYSKL